MYKLKLGESSNILNVWYEPDNKQLKIEFMNHRQYIYYEIEQSLVDEWEEFVKNGGSVGEFFDARIRKDKSIKFRRVV